VIVEKIEGLPVPPLTVGVPADPPDPIVIGKDVPPDNDNFVPPGNELINPPAPPPPPCLYPPPAPPATTK
jgi:hypothetical protein